MELVLVLFRQDLCLRSIWLFLWALDSFVPFDALSYRSSFNFFLRSAFSLSALLALTRAAIAINGIAMIVKTIRAIINSMAYLSGCN